LPLPLPEPPAFGEPVSQSPAPEVLHFLARRRSASAVTLAEPAPSPAEVEALLRIAVRVPDHGKLSPWRFVLLQGDAKGEAVGRLEALANDRDDARAAAKLAKLKLPPLAVVVVSRARPGLEIPEWEQQLSAGAVCTLLLISAQAMGYGANWITDWYSYDAEARAILGLAPEERIAGVVMLGTAKEAPLERERADPAALTSVWRP
jgi:nitroreductase